MLVSLGVGCVMRLGKRGRGGKKRLGGGRLCLC
jgi:hypothetical protein